jgi:hypothetical protein
VPHNFTAAGDVSMAYDLQFTNSSASYIKSSAPLYIEAGDPNQSHDLTLRASNNGYVVVDDSLQVGTSSTPTLFANSGNGFVGIGTATPSVRLTVYDSTASQQIRIGSSDSNYWSLGRDYTTGYFKIGDRADNYRLVIDYSSGNVGIGNTAPTSKLTVNGGDMVVSSAGAATTTISSATSTFAGGLIVDTNSLYVMADTNRVGIGTSAPAAPLHVVGVGGNGILVDNGGWVDAYTGVYTTQVNANRGSSTFNLGLYSGSAANVILGPSTEAMRIASTSNVGIGNTNPTSKLTVNGGNMVVSTNGTATTTISSGVSYLAGGVVSQASSTIVGNLSVGTSSTPTLFVDSGNGRVGIGTTSPTEILSLYGDNKFFLSQRTNNTSYFGTKFKTGAVDDFFFGLRETGDSNFHLYSYGASADAITVLRSNGNVGMGNTNPTSKLTVNGGNMVVSTNGSATTTISSGVSYLAGGLVSQASSTIAGNLSVGTSTTPTLFANSGNGYVGIGTASPNRALEIIDVYTGGMRVARSGAADQYVEILNSGTILSSPAIGGLNLALGSQNMIQMSDVGGDSISIMKSGGTGTFFDYASGNVGIGTTTPRYKLDVWGNLAVGTSTSPLLFADAGNSLITFGGDVSLGSIQVASSSGVVTFVDMIVESSASVGTEESLSFQIDSNPIFRIYSESDGLGGIQNKRAIVESGASLGVATSSPRYALDVWGNVGFGTSTAGWNGTTGASSTPALYVLSGMGGQVGIGTTTLSTNLLTVGTTTNSLIVANNGYTGIGATSTPSEKLSVAGNIMGSGNAVFYGTASSTFAGGLQAAAIKLTTGGSAGKVLTSDANGFGYWATSVAGSGGSNWQFAGANAIRPTSTVGIILSASSTIAGNLSVGTSSTPTLFVNSGNGYVGIGTTSPAVPLDVVGTIRTTGDTTPTTGKGVGI